MYELDAAQSLALARSPELDRFQRSHDNTSPYAVATVVRTSGATAAKAGARAIVTEAGDLIGFIGGGCVRRAVITTGLTALKEQTPRLIRAKPRDAMSEAEVTEGLDLHPSGCPSRGEIDVFIEPVLPKPPLIVIGEGRISHWMRIFGDAVGLHPFCAETAGDAEQGWHLPGIGRGFAVVATQGRGDKAGLTAALQSDVDTVFFISSAKKAAHWRRKLEAENLSADRLAKLKAPAGLDIGARSPGEIALAITAEIVQRRHRTPA